LRHLPTRDSSPARVVYLISLKGTGTMPTNRYDSGLSYVTPPLRIESGSRPDLVSSRAVVGAVEALLSTYAEQQRGLEGEVLPGEWGEPGYSTAGELRERRLSSLMYLVALVSLTAVTVAGLVLLGRQLVSLSGSYWFAFWLGLTGGLSLILVAGLHSKELGLSREGLEHHRIDSESDLAGARVNVQREIMLKALETQATLAQAELETKAAQRAAHEAEVERLRLAAPAAQPEPATEADPLFVRAAQWFERVLEFSPAGEYGRLAEDGRLRKGELCILAERGGLTDSQRQRLAAALERCSPWLLTYDSGAKLWRVNAPNYPTAAQATAALKAAW
jgi:hypothetical protein